MHPGALQQNQQLLGTCCLLERYMVKIKETGFTARPTTNVEQAMLSIRATTLNEIETDYHLADLVDPNEERCSMIASIWVRTVEMHKQSTLERSTSDDKSIFAKNTRIEEA
jgi:hypothetical protein